MQVVNLRHRDGGCTLHRTILWLLSKLVIGWGGGGGGQGEGGGGEWEVEVGVWRGGLWFTCRYITTSAIQISALLSGIIFVRLGSLVER